MRRQNERFEMRVSMDLLARIDAWREAQAKLNDDPQTMSRAEAIRRLALAALDTEAQQKVVENTT